ncbi:MAG: nucleotidyltransferase family protein [Candidatus Omnitrophica bacterium]|nr:nucleotidyltransferase family protein [Candidatus Omnitrophota bacterium]
MEVLILAAGYAVRLQPLTLDNPKPLLEIGGRKIADRLLDKIARIKGVSAVYVVVNNKFFEHFKRWAKDSPDKNKLSLINDGTDSNENRLGAIRDLELSIREKATDDDLLVIAGDNLFEFDLADFVRFAQSHSDGVSVALHDIGDVEAAKRFGVVKVGADDKVVEFEEKPLMPKSTLVSTGIYYFPKDKLSLIPKYVSVTDKKTDAPGYCISWMSSVDNVYGFAFSEDWHDIGDMETYRKVDEAYKQKER